MKGKSNTVLILAHAFLGVGFFFIYVHHVRTVFESKTNYGRLTKLGREALLRNEDALYYSFYKTIAEDYSFESGYKKLLNLTSIEYPNSVNAVQKFHILPEICIGYIYHQFRYLSKQLHIPTVSCWTMDGSDGEQIMTCDGVGDPFNFYMEFVWCFGGLTVFIIYMYSSFLSETSFGGIYAVVLYIIFHKYASKIYERPVARENFAFPFILWQMFYLNLCIDKAARSSSSSYPRSMRLFMIKKFTFITTVSLLCWQFSSVIYATQILILLIPQNLSGIESLFCVDYATSQLMANLLAFHFTYGNKKFFLSWQNGPTLALLCFSIQNMFRNRRKQGSPASSVKYSTLGLILAFSMQGSITDILEKSGYTHPDDNPYTTYRDLILYWTLQRRTNFTTTLLACSEGFNEVQFDDCWELIKTLIVKPLCLYSVVVLAQFLRKLRRKFDTTPKEEKIERAKNYVLEDFLEENHISMKEMSKEETQRDLNVCLEILKSCDYDYEKYKIEKMKCKSDKSSEHDDFINDVKKLKNQISKNEQRKDKSKLETQETKDDDIPDDKNNEDAAEDPSTTEQSTKSGSSNSQAKPSCTDGGILANFSYYYLYSVMQFAIFSWIGVTLKKLFFLCFTLGCILAPTLCSKFWYRKQPNIFWTVSVIVFLSSIFDPGVQNIEREYFPDLPANDDLELMLEWINLNTEKDAVFGGPVEVIGTVHLATQRPIVNHPFLELKDISERTDAIYSVFSRQQSSDIYNQCSQLKLQYLIVSLNKCSNSTDDECDMLSIWDEMQPSHRKHSQFCTELVNKNIPSFLKVFSNGHYGIIKMFSQSVQLSLKYHKLPEKVM